MEVFKDQSPLNCAEHPTKIKLNNGGEYKQKISDQRTQIYVCTNIKFSRIFVAKKEMNRHLRNNHLRTQVSSETKRHKFLIADYSKSYITMEWLHRHIRSCHLQHNQPIKTKIETLKFSELTTSVLIATTDMKSTQLEGQRTNNLHKSYSQVVQKLNR